MNNKRTDELLYTRGEIGTLKLKNRWIMLAMHTGYARADGGFSERDFAFYRERANGGMAAITLVGAVNEEGAQENMHRLDLPICDAGLKKVCDIIHGGETKVIVQLFHAGRNRKITEEQPLIPVAPSELPSPIYRTMPREINDGDIQRTISDFADAAEKCKNCGADAVEVSVSVGYLLSQFLSPLVNKRMDRWGGDDKRRMAFPTEVLSAIRKKVGDNYPILIKISGGDMLGGYDLQYMVDFIKQLPKGTIDGVTVTGGWHEAPIPQMTFHVKPGAFSYLAHEIKEKTGLPTIACNRINSEAAAEKILQDKDADFVGAARPFLTEPQFINKMHEGKPYFQCQACNKGCIERVLKGKDVVCAFRPETGREYLKRIPECIGKKVLVVGAGPVGLMTAIYAAQSGNKVILITKDAQTGGRINLACRPPYKQELKQFTDAAEANARMLGVDIRIDTPVSEEFILENQIQEVYFATGASPIRFPISGLEDVNVYTADEILSDDSIELRGNVVIVGGGSVGLETADFIAAHSNPKEKIQITVVEMAEKAGKDLGGTKWIMMKALKEYDVKVLTYAKLVRGEACRIVLEKDGNELKLPTDTLIFAVGSKPLGCLNMEEFLQQHKIPYHIVGDAKKAVNVMNGLHNLYQEFFQLQK